MGEILVVGLQVEMAGASHVGLYRKTNQDSFYIDKELGIGILADGIGGRNGGKAASSMAVSHVEKRLLEVGNISDAEIAPLMAKAIDEANISILKTGLLEPQLSGMGTTIEVFKFTPTQIYMAHVGDSRTYLFYNKQFWQLTIDHNVDTFLRRGWLKKEALPKNYSGDALMRGLGLAKKCEVDIYKKRIQPGEIYIVASDGLFDLVRNSVIAQIVAQHADNMSDLVSTLVDQANRNGGKDNVSVIAAKVFEASPPDDREANL